MEELIRQQLNQREQELKMFGQQPATPLPVQRRDESLKNEIDELRVIVMQLKERVESIKETIESTKENMNKTI
jgi:predicted RNase H-like nuclease (RuvC/YqgF family)